MIYFSLKKTLQLNLCNNTYFLIYKVSLVPFNEMAFCYPILKSTYFVFTAHGNVENMQIMIFFFILGCFMPSLWGYYF